MCPKGSERQIIFTNCREFAARHPGTLKMWCFNNQIQVTSPFYLHNMILPFGMVWQYSGHVARGQKLNSCFEAKCYFCIKTHALTIISTNCCQKTIAYCNLTGGNFFEPPPSLGIKLWSNAPIFSIGWWRQSHRIWVWSLHQFKQLRSRKMGKTLGSRGWNGLFSCEFDNKYWH